MQPEPTEPSTLNSYLASPESPDNTIQHGLLSLESRIPGQDGPPDSSGSVDRISVPRDEFDASTASGLESNNRVLKGPDNRANRPKASTNLITEYENAMLPAKQKRNSDGPEFRIVKRKVVDPDAPVTHFEDFPNEVLTHILSHLPATSLSSVSLVSHRFYALVTTPHAWRVAFGRFFPGQHALEEADGLDSDHEEREQLRSELRFFTRLTALASWRSEYVIRTRLLRSLSRGKPTQIAPGHGASSRAISAANNANPVVTYTSQMFSTIDHIHAAFGTGKKSIRFIHGTEETGSACTSDPNIGKIDAWGLSDPQALPQFTDLFPGDPQYGLGAGLLIGAPNVMDVSQPYGMLYGEGFPGGQTYYRSTDEMRGRFLASSTPFSNAEAGIPKLTKAAEAVCSVWIAKSNNVPLNTDGLVGILSGSSSGVITSYSLGADNIGASRIVKGEITAKWVLSPGVPIIAIAVDESYNAKRKSNGRVWAVALNALGEIFYLTATPERCPVVDHTARVTEQALEILAWETGRSVYWHISEATRRVAHDDPYNCSEIDGSYSPRSSSRDMKLTNQQIQQETREIEKYLDYMPAHFRKVCKGWDMRRRLEVDFAGDDGFGAGEAVFVIRCGHEENEQAEVKRFMRCRSEQASREEYPLPKTPPMAPNVPTMASLFGGGDTAKAQHPAASSSPPKGPATPSRQATDSGSLVEEWFTSVLSLQEQPDAVITTSAIDLSTFALMTTWEDPLLTVAGRSSSDSPFASPPTQAPEYSLHNIPGYRGRFIAIGTDNGSITLWNMRGPHSEDPSIVNELQSLRTIHTDSPQVSCLAVSALYIVHGGNDGLVQAWDPLASSLEPTRTLNSRFASRARRRLVQAEASVQGVGINLYAAGAIIVDPDPTVLRGMVSLGTHLRYWSYSSSAADQYASKKRRLRRSNERGSNSGPDRFSNTGRGALMDYIATEQQELKLDKERRAREDAHLRGRFGVGIADMTDEEALRYAEMVSQETFLKEDEERRLTCFPPIDPLEGSSSTLTKSLWSSESSGNSTPDGKKSDAKILGHQKPAQIPAPRYKSEDEFEHDIEEAIRLSLLDGVDDGGRSPKAFSNGQYEVEIKYKSKSKKSSRKGSGGNSVDSRSSSGLDDRVVPGKENSHRQKSAKYLPIDEDDVRQDDMELALRLSLLDVQGRESEMEGGEVYEQMNGHGDVSEEFPSLEAKDDGKKGKGRAV